MCNDQPDQTPDGVGNGTYCYWSEDPDQTSPTLGIYSGYEGQAFGDGFYYENVCDQWSWCYWTPAAAVNWNEGMIEFFGLFQEYGGQAVFIIPFDGHVSDYCSTDDFYNSCFGAPMDGCGDIIDISFSHDSGIGFYLETNRGSYPTDAYATNASNWASFYIKGIEPPKQQQQEL